MFNIKRKRGKKLIDEELDLPSLKSTDDGKKRKEERPLFFDENLKDLITPDGLNPNPLSYMVINDSGMDCYTRTMYIHSMPKRCTFATTFAPLFDYPDCVASTYVLPVTEGRAIRQLDSRVVKVESELYAAIKEGDTNRKRKMQNKLHKTEAWAQNIESGENTLYEVALVFTIFGYSKEDLELNTKRFVALGSEKGIEICNCYSVQPEAFLSNAPFNKIYGIGSGPLGIIKQTGIKLHAMDKYSVSTIFHHTNSSFTHKNGVPAGRNLNNAEPILYDPYDKSHNGYGIIFTGKTGTGKSATIKMYISRLLHHHYRFASVDTEKKGNRGEYSLTAESLGGLNFKIGQNSDHIINFFELDVQLEYDESTDTEYKVLRVNDKIDELTHIMLSIVHGNKQRPTFEMSTYLHRIIRDTIEELFNEKEIYDGQVNSLFTKGMVLDNGVLKEGRVKKNLPTMSDFFVRLIIKQKNDHIEYHREAYAILIDIVKDLVKYVIINKKSMITYTEETYLQILENKTEELTDIWVVKGTKSYYDGQSTIKFTNDTPMLNIDISDLPPDDKPIGQEIALNFLNENFIKRNSENPRLAKKMVIIIDEAHRMFPFNDARVFLGDLYRTARKRHVSPWTCTQALKDFDGHSDTEAIITNATSIFMFKQDYQHAKYLSEHTILTESQIRKVCSIGGDPDDDTDTEHKGEACLIDNNRVVFLKVDYLPSERAIVETNIDNVKRMRKERANVKKRERIGV